MLLTVFYIPMKIVSKLSYYGLLTIVLSAFVNMIIFIIIHDEKVKFKKVIHKLNKMNKQHNFIPPLIQRIAKEIRN